MLCYSARVYCTVSILPIITFVSYDMRDTKSHDWLLGNMT